MRLTEISCHEVQLLCFGGVGGGWWCVRELKYPAYQKTLLRVHCTNVDISTPTIFVFSCTLYFRPFKSAVASFSEGMRLVVTAWTVSQNLQKEPLWIKPTDDPNSSFIDINILHVSGRLSAHHQEFLAVHQLWYILCSCDRLLPGVGCYCSAILLLVAYDYHNCI